MACLAAQSYHSEEVALRGDSNRIVRALNGEAALVDRVLVGLVASYRSAIEEMTRAGRTANIWHVPRGDNQTTDGLANGAMDKSSLTPKSPCSWLSLLLSLGGLRG